LPTVPREMATRHDQLSRGLATRLDALRPVRADAQMLAQLLAPDVPRWPDHYACWSPRDRRIVELSAPDPTDRAQWVNALEQAAAPHCAPPRT
jgi:hypothetical protein